jgi:hypothetical protein
MQSEEWGEQPIDQKRLDPRKSALIRVRNPTFSEQVKSVWTRISRMQSEERG